MDFFAIDCEEYFASASYVADTYFCAIESFFILLTKLQILDYYGRSFFLIVKVNFGVASYGNTVFIACDF